MHDNGDLLVVDGDPLEDISIMADDYFSVIDTQNLSNNNSPTLLALLSIFSPVDSHS